jgi:hypothetical protein
MLLTVPAASAGKPTHTLPHPSASRSIGPESLAHTGRHQSPTAVRALKRRVRTADKSVESRRSASGKRQRREAVRAEAKAPKVREVKARHGRGLRKLRAAEREQQKPGRAAVATFDQPVRTRDGVSEGRFGLTPVRVTTWPGRPDGDNHDSDSVSASAQQAFGSLSPLKSIEQEAAAPVLLPNLRVASLYDSRGRLMVPPPLYGSHEILLRQNQMAGKDGLDRVRNDADLEQLLRDKKLVALPANETLEVDDRLPGNRRYSRPWTAAFLSVLSRDYYANFHQPLQVTSAVRTVQVQQRLERTNGNAAPASGESASPHLTGQAIDLAKHGLTMAQIAWLRTYLQPLIGDGKIDVEEEFRQACFHISVYRKFLPMVPRVAVAESRQAPEDRP